MDIKIKLDLSRYTADEIISFVKEGVITVQEVRESGIVWSFFNSDLDVFLRDYER